MKKPRVIVTTDLEVDDMNSLVHLSLYLNLIDLEAVITTASQYHFLGDGSHTLAEANPHWRTRGQRACEERPVPPEPDPAAGQLRSYRPFPPNWVEHLWSGPYAEAWPYLCENAAAAGEPAFPSPQELLARTYEGNISFEGDVRKETPGSRVIANAILDDDPRTLWLLSWGGMNTIVRALMSIAERYAGAPSWPEVRSRVYAKVRVMGVTDGIGQDNSWKDRGRALFPDLAFMRAPFIYGSYLDAKYAQADSLPLFQAPWPEQNLVRDNGPLMAEYKLYGDGKHYEGEPERFQFGEHATLDWGLGGMEPMRFSPGDFLAEGDSMTYIPLLPLGLAGADDPRFSTLLGPLYRDGEPSPTGEDPGLYGTSARNPFLRAYQEDFAARAQWCAHAANECNHAPVIEGVCPKEEIMAVPGQAIRLEATASDPDGNALEARWFVDAHTSRYDGEAELEDWRRSDFLANFEVPGDARPRDRFVLTLVVRDDAARPMTRYAQVLVTCRSR